MDRADVIAVGKKNRITVKLKCQGCTQLSTLDLCPICRKYLCPACLAKHDSGWPHDRRDYAP